MSKHGSRIKGFTYLRILLPTLLTIILLIVAIFIIVIPQFEGIVIDRKREMIRELTNSTISMINNWHQMELNGELTKSAAQAKAIDQTSNLRYGNELKDYFWITDMNPNMIAHPYRPDLNGKDLSNVKDSHQKVLFVEMVKVVEKYGEGYVDYMWQWKDDSDKIVPKLSYVKKFEQWNWVVGTGIYIEDVKEEMARLEQKIITISIIITILSSMLLIYIAYQNLKSERKRKEAEEELRESREKYRLLVEASGEGLIMILENRQVFYNKTFLSMLNYENGNKELTLSDIFNSYPDSQIFDFKEFKNTNDLVNEQIETKVKSQTGQIIDVLLSISPITISNNKGIVISVKDISKHKEIEEALDYTLEKYLALTNHISIGVFKATPDKNIKFTEVNPALVQILGVDEESELLSKSFLNFFYDRNDELLFNSELEKSGYIKNKIIQIQKSSGSLSTVSLSAVLVKNIENKKLSIDGIVEDIGEIQKSNDEREQLIADLQNSVLILKQSIIPHTKKIPTCKVDTSLDGALLIMKNHNINNAIVIGENEKVIGMITEQDIERQLHTNGDNRMAQISEINTSPVVSLDANSTIFDALVKFKDTKAHFLVIQNDDEKLTGLLDRNDLFEASYSNYLFFIEKISNASTIEDIKLYRKQLLLLLKNMIESEMNIRGVTNIISAISDAITKRIIEKAIGELGEPPVKFAFITMGSEGREEQTLFTDQDNAIIFEDVPKEKEETVRKYFKGLGEMVCDDLNSVGYDYCKGGIMAKNEKWCQPIISWERNFTKWVTTADPQDLLESKIFFDFRFVFGDDELSGRLRNHVNKLTKNCNTFFVYLSENVLRAEIPSNAYKLKDTIDLKILLLPIVDFARLYSLKNNFISTNTIKRLDQLFEKGKLTETNFKNILFSFNSLMRLRLLHQIECSTANSPIDNNIKPQTLSDFDVLIIKRYFEQLESLKSKISLDFKGTVTF